ncbi:MAG: hypothetical protein HXY30_14920 [Pseudorhodoplanes sp.]|nr:hypothetical protein [Pseudorhodoplanes sp.]
MPGLFATVTEFCNALPKQDYVIKGKTPHDQAWIDDTSAVTVAGCGRPRPAERPKGWDGPTHTVGGKTVPVPVPPARPKPAAKPKQRLPAAVLDRIRALKE